MPAVAGSDTRITYLWEDDGSGNPKFAASSPNDSTYKTFGFDARLTDGGFDNDPVNLFDPASREAAERIARTFQGTWTIEFTLSNPWFWKAVLADPTTTGGSAPYTHSFDGDTPYPMRIILGEEVNTNERVLIGCVASTCTLETSDGGAATVTLSGAYADESESSGSLQSQVSESRDALMFADGSLTFDSTTYSVVQNVSLTIENNISLIPELGSRTMVDYSPKVRDTTVDWEKIVENDDILKDGYGGSSGGTSPQSRVDGDDEFSGSFVFDNQGSGSGLDKHTINFAGTFPDSFDRSGYGDPTTELTDGPGWYVREVDVDAENGVSTAK